MPVSFIFTPFHYFTINNLFFAFLHQAPIRRRGYSEGYESPKEAGKKLAMLKRENYLLRDKNISLKQQLKREKNKNQADRMPEGLRALNNTHKKNASAKPQGRRWSLDIKLLALNIYRRGPRAYSYL